MNEKREDGMGRRDFFRTFARVAIAGGIGFLVGNLAGRRLDPRKHTCRNRSVCCNCPAFNGCELPAATTARNAGADFRT